MKKLMTLLAAPALAMGLAACDVEQTQEGQLPDVDVQGGSMPKYDVDAPDVDVNSKPAEVTVPDIDINTEKQQVQVPDIDVTMPNDNDADGAREEGERPAPAAQPAQPTNP